MPEPSLATLTREAPDRPEAAGRPESAAEADSAGRRKAAANELKITAAGWKQVVAPYQQSSTRQAVWQLVNTVLPYLGLWVAMYFAVQVSWWLAGALAVVAGLFLIRTFILFHDCCHGSMFASRRANDICGGLLGILALTPYVSWRTGHATHHGAAGDLDRRGDGDVWTLTVDEYLASSRLKRLGYRFARHPMIMLGLVPLVLFVGLMRFARPHGTPAERRSVLRTNLTWLFLAPALALLFGPWNYLFLQLITTAVGGGIGVWLFYAQHQYEDTYWERREDWNYEAAALQGSSYIELPRILQWFSGNIGFHHVHHLAPKIPNYRLESCHREHEMFSGVPKLTLFSGLRTLMLTCWDEKQGRLVGMREVKARERARRETESTPAA